MRGLTAIEGTCGRSTLYGVYYFLETYGGCRFYARDCEVLPSPGAFRLPDAIDDRCSPALSFRDVDWFEAHDAAFAAKLRINSDHNRVNNAAYGKTMHYAGDRFVHTFSALLPPEPWFESHPEYFALREDGERDRGALCLSHPEVVRLLTRGALDALEGRSGGGYSVGVAERQPAVLPLPRLSGRGGRGRQPGRPLDPRGQRRRRRGGAAASSCAGGYAGVHVFPKTLPDKAGRTT